MAIEYSKGKTTVSAKMRLFVVTIIGLAVMITSSMLLSWHIAPLLGWDVAAAVFALWVWLSIWRMDGQITAEHALREDPSRKAAEAAILVASVASLGAVGMVLAASSSNHGLPQLAQVALGIASVMVSWTTVHTLFTLRYAELFYSNPRGGVDFNDGMGATYRDFAYLAFTVGMTYQVSDTSLQTKEFRTTILKHALISYLFGAIIIAVTINLIAGLSK